MSDGLAERQLRESQAKRQCHSSRSLCHTWSAARPPPPGSPAARHQTLGGSTQGMPAQQEETQIELNAYVVHGLSTAALPGAEACKRAAMRHVPGDLLACASLPMPPSVAVSREMRPMMGSAPVTCLAIRFMLSASPSLQAPYGGKQAHTQAGHHAGILQDDSAGHIMLCHHKARPIALQGCCSAPLCPSLHRPPRRLSWLAALPRLGGATCEAAAALRMCTCCIWQGWHASWKQLDGDSGGGGRSGGQGTATARLLPGPPAAATVLLLILLLRWEASIAASVLQRGVRVGCSLGAAAAWIAMSECRDCSGVLRGVLVFALARILGFILRARLACIALFLPAPQTPVSPC